MKMLRVHLFLKWLRLPAELRARLIEVEWRWRIRGVSDIELALWIARARELFPRVDR